MLDIVFHSHSEPLNERLEKAAKTYSTVQDYMGWNSQKPFEEIREEARNFSLAQRAHLAELYQKQIDALEGIQVSKAYLDIMDDIHQTTITAIKQKYGGKNIGKLSDAQTIEFMQCIGDEQRRAWQEKFPDIFSDYPPTIVAQNDEMPFSLFGDAKDGYRYNVPENHGECIGTLAGIAAHEPQHSVQNFLCEKMRNGFDLPEPLKEAAIMFDFLANYNVQNYPPGIFRSGSDNDSADVLNENAYKAYRAIPREAGAFHQGDLMEREIKNMFPALKQGFVSPSF